MIELVNIDFKKLFDLSGQIIVITGHKGLIGRAFVEACTQFGATVEGWDIPEVDVSSTKDIEDNLDALIAKYDKIDGLVNCHQYIGPGFFDSFEDYDDDVWDKIIDVNLKGTYLTCKHIGKHMKQNNKGSIVNVVSTYSIVAPNPSIYEGMNNTLKNPAAYGTSKSGIIMMSKYLAVSWAKHNIRVNMITPHGVWNNHEEIFQSNFSKLSPMGRLSYNHEVASGLIYLLSDASSYVTGHNLIIDGGWSIW